jgi:AbrB family looped-hinge helix DNA binding protein
MASATQKLAMTLEATVTSKGQITLPMKLRERLGIQKGSRIQFSIPIRGAVKIESVRYNLEDLWSMADQAGRIGGVMTFKEMDAAKAQRHW